MGDRNIRINLSYDGTDYYGWQRLKDFPTVEETVGNAVLDIFGEKAEIHGAGRTDSGVHAICFPANFHVSNSVIPSYKIPLLLNRQLPASIRVLSAMDVPLDFHSRFSCIAREYFYFSWNDSTIPPFFSRYACHEYRKLSINKIKECCEFFKGRHHFRSFTSAYEEGFDYQRTVYHFRVKQIGPRFYYFIKGEGFLHGMIRDLVSLTTHYSLGDVSKDMILAALRGETMLPPALRTRAPANGLYFKRGFY